MAGRGKAPRGRVVAPRVSTPRPPRAPMTPSGIAAAGAVDLGALAAARKAQADREAAAAQRARTGGGATVTVVDVTEADFQAEVVERSQQVPVVLDFWAEWCGPCKQLSPVLERLAVEGDGSWVLAKVDVDANPRLSQAFGVQSIPTVVAVVDGQVVSGFPGAIPEAQLREWLSQLLAAVQQMRAEGGTPGDPAAAGDPDAGPVGPPLEPEEVQADEALQRGDLDGAAEAFRALAARTPANASARTGLARVELIRRVRSRDAQEVRDAGATAPDDLEAQLAVADLDMAQGHVDDAFGRLLGLVRERRDEDRDAARARLLELLDVLSADDPRLPATRRALAAALF